MSSWAKDDMFDAIVTSPVYGNRMSDQYHIKDDSKRITYQAYLGRFLHKNNSGGMNWGSKYRDLHRKVYNECKRVLRPNGRFILNISNHIRKGEEVPVDKFHIETLDELGFKMKDRLFIETPRLRHGANSKLRVKFEQIIIFDLKK